MGASRAKRSEDITLEEDFTFDDAAKIGRDKRWVRPSSARSIALSCARRVIGRAS